MSIFDNVLIGTHGEIKPSDVLRHNRSKTSSEYLGEEKYMSYAIDTEKFTPSLTHSPLLDSP